MNPTYLIMIADLLAYANKIDYFNFTSRDYREFHDSIMTAVENAIESNVEEVNTYTIDDSYTEYLSGRCPECQEFLSESENYCPCCGKSLRWEL